MEQSALDRLYDSVSSTSESEHSSYTIDEQLLSTDDSDDLFLDGMSDESKQALFNRVKPEKIELEEESEDAQDENVEEELIDEVGEEQEEVKEDSKKEEEPKKRGRGRPSKAKEKEEESYNNVSGPYTAIMDTLISDLIASLKESDYKIYNFNKYQMSIIYAYLEKKLKGENV